MSRLTWILCSTLCPAAWAIAPGPASAAPGAAPRQPHVVFILADDLGYGDVGAYNPASRIPTPNVDRLASEGIRFTDAHSPAAVCTPTRYGILVARLRALLAAYRQSDRSRAPRS